MTPLDVPPELRQHDQYEILRELGRGGMGVVYLARNRLMKRLEVLKVVNPQLLDHADTRTRFLREISSAAQLHDPYIVTAYAALQLGNLLVLAMEYVEGENLHDVVRRVGSLPLVNACYYLQQTALGLQHAFEKGMVHRDVKPHNLILGQKGNKPVVKILDFGLAKLTNQLEATSGKLTQSGATMGTPLYMAPEQIQDAASADIRADIYSLGCTGYYLLAGKPPFEATNQFELMHAHLQREATPLNRVRRDVPVELAAVVAKMMAKVPAQRYQKPVEVARALAPFVKGGPKPLPDVSGQASGGRQPVAEAPTQRSEAPRSRDPFRTANAETESSATEVHEEVRRAAVARAPSEIAGRSRKWLLGAGIGTMLLMLVGVLGLWASGMFRHEPHDDSLVVLPTTPASQGPNDSGPKPVSSADDELVARVKNASGIELVAIPSGWFYMGANAAEEGALDDEKPRHKVTIAQSFYLGKYKVTVGQFRRFVDAAGYQTEAEKAGDNNTWRAPGFPQTEDHPVVYVSWNDADAYCKWLAKATGAKLRLPRDAEREYSCRAQPNTTTTTSFAFGDSDASFGDYAWFSGNSEGHTQPCGLKKPNAFGAYDMHGLAWEWCADGRRTYQNKDETDPVGPGAGTPRVLRGGSWRNDPRRCRAASRNVFAPSLRYNNLGFRVLVVR